MSDSLDSPPNLRPSAPARAATLQVPLVRFMNKWLMPLMPLVPVPHRYLHWLFVRDNATENSADGWGRLRATSEVGRYAVIQGFLEHFTPGGSLLDVGCSDGILQERVRYGRYTGIDMFADTIAKASRKSDANTRFFQADAATYVPDEQFDAIVWNECLYYLAQPIEVIKRYPAYLRPNGVIIVSMFYQTFATRRLFRQLSVLGPVVADLRISTGGASWLVRAYRPEQPARLAREASR
jgi:2-polyprenyl-3-methyl-5-hydroxy-6-metoxy-1,4-benzoquinol methylase